MRASGISVYSGLDRTVRRVHVADCVYSEEGTHSFPFYNVNLARLRRALPADRYSPPVQMCERPSETEQGLASAGGSRVGIRDAITHHSLTSATLRATLPKTPPSFLPQPPSPSVRRLFTRTMTSPASQSMLSSASPENTSSKFSGAPAGICTARLCCI